MYILFNPKALNILLYNFMDVTTGMFLVEIIAFGHYIFFSSKLFNLTDLKLNMFGTYYG